MQTELPIQFPPSAPARAGIINPNQQGLHFLVAHKQHWGPRSGPTISSNTAVSTAKVMPIKLNFSSGPDWYQMKSGPLSEVKTCTRHLGVGVKLGRRVGTSVGSALE